MRKHLFTPSNRICGVMSNTAEEASIGFSKVLQEAICSDTVGKINTVLSAVFLNPVLHHVKVGICRVVLRQALSDEFDSFMCHGTNRLSSEQEAEVNIGSTNKLRTVKLELTDVAECPFLEFLTETTTSTEFGEYANLDFTLNELINLFLKALLCIFDNLLLLFFSIGHTEPNFRNNRHHRNFMIRNINIVAAELNIRLLKLFIERTNNFITVDSVTLEETNIVVLHEINLLEMFQFPRRITEL